MLVLQRKKGETLLLGEDIRITVTEVGNDAVKLAIDAPRNVTILRGELQEAIDFNREAVVDHQGVQNLRKIIQKG
jgi:carbon storage regulator